MLFARWRGLPVWMWLVIAFGAGLIVTSAVVGGIDSADWPPL